MSTGCKSSHSGFLDVSRSNGGLRISGWIGQLSCLTDYPYLLTNWVPGYSHTPLYLLDNTRQSYNSHTVNLTSNPHSEESYLKWFSRDHCCRGRSKPGCRIVGSHTRWELTTWADFQLCLHRHIETNMQKHLIKVHVDGSNECCSHSGEREETMFPVADVHHTLVEVV